MPQQPRIERMLNLKERAKKDRNAQKPCDAANCRGKPWQMNQSPARLRERFRIGRPPGAEAVEQIAKRENSFDPQKNADRVNDAVIEYDRFEEALFQCGSEQRLNNCRIVPDVERASEDLWNHWRQRCHQQVVTFARSTRFNFDGHKIDFLLSSSNLSREIPNPKEISIAKF